ncbi:MAG: protease modulator HflC [Myxococcales bacterium]|nr:protease modulator HflC [Myxococcales bacterium]MCB9582941.1 protease modulator HflC [Polyangiaceae bacterium]
MKASLVIFVLLALFVGWSSVFVVDEKELAIVTQFGEYKRTAERPGLYFKIPFAQTVTFMEGRILGSDTPPAEYLTLDKKRLVADPITRWRITDPLMFFKTVHDESGAKARLDDIINSELRRELASHNFGDIVGNARDPMMQRVASSVRAQTKSFGIEIVDVRIKRADLPREVQDSVFARMRAERDRVAKQYRSEGEEEAQKIRAETDKEKTIILAKAYETSQKVRGEGDATSIKVYAEAYGKDPEFYAFTRSLDAYEKSVDDKSTVVLSSGSDLFRYFGQPKP